MRINLNIKKRQKSIKKVTKNTIYINNTNCNNFYYNKLKLQPYTITTTNINSYIKWSRCNSNILKNFNRGSFDKNDISQYLSNLSFIERQLKIKHKREENDILKKASIYNNNFTIIIILIIIVIVIVIIVIMVIIIIIIVNLAN